MANYLQVLLFSGLAILMWGLWGFFGKLALDRHMTPFAVFFVEVLVSVACALPLFFCLHEQRQMKQPFASWNIYGLLSGAGLALGLVFYYLALEKGLVSVVVPLTAIYPVISVLLGYALLNERLSTGQLMGVILIVAGVMLLVGVPVDNSTETR